jgi:hypothetical protein
VSPDGFGAGPAYFDNDDAGCLRIGQVGPVSAPGRNRSRRRSPNLAATRPGSRRLSKLPEPCSGTDPAGPRVTGPWALSTDPSMIMTAESPCQQASCGSSRGGIPRQVLVGRRPIDFGSSLDRRWCPDRAETSAKIVALASPSIFVGPGYPPLTSRAATAGASVNSPTVEFSPFPMTY